MRRIYFLITFFILSFPSQATLTANAELVASGLENPWSVVQLPNGNFLVSERTGHISLVNAEGNTIRLQGVPEITAERQGGALGLALHPQFAENNTFYACIVVADSSGATSSEVHKGQLSGTTWTNVQPVVITRPKDKSGFHFGCRLAFDADNALLVSLGDRSKGKERTQDLDNHYGKILRVDENGQPHNDNPFLGSAVPEVYSVGHRNVQGLAIHPNNGAIWAHEHGPKGGDEINLIKSGANYGWPTITYGVNYNGTSITDKTAAPGLEQPFHYYVPSIAPSGIAFLGEDMLLGSLKFRYLRYVDIEQGRVVAEYNLLTEMEKRVRDVIVGHDQHIYIVTDEINGGLYRVTLSQ